MMTSQRKPGFSTVYRYPAIVIAMTDQDVIERASGMFGTSTYAKPVRSGWKPQWRATASGSSAAAWMRQLYPWLGMRRRARIEEILTEYAPAEDPITRFATPTDSLNWLAGLLEGEGYFGTIKNRVGGKAYRYPRVGVSMTDQDVITRVATMFGLGMYTIKAPGNSHGYLDSYRAWSTGEAGANWMRRLHPLMGARRQSQISVALAEWDAREPMQVRRRRACSEAAAKRSRRADGTFERAS